MEDKKNIIYYNYHTHFENYCIFNSGFCIIPIPGIAAVPNPYIARGFNKFYPAPGTPPNTESMRVLEYWSVNLCTLSGFFSAQEIYNPMPI